MQDIYCLSLTWYANGSATDSSAGQTTSKAVCKVGVK